MTKKIYVHFLILCGILCQGMTENLLNDDVREPSDVLVRKKRVIHLEGDGGSSTRIEEVPYIVNIKQDGRSICAGAILSHYSVITAAPCVQYHIAMYQVESGSGYPQRSTVHNVTSKATHYGNSPHGHYDGISLITIDLPFVFSRSTEAVSLHVGALAEGTSATVSGWGSWHPLSSLRGVRRRLRSITVPVMNIGVCQRIYRRQYPITNKHICTYAAQKCCAQSDEGAPLVVNNKLVGIYVWKGILIGMTNPDVFVNVQNFEYSQWIINNTVLI